MKKSWLILAVLVFALFNINFNNVSAQTVNDSGCLPGYKFSVTTGEPCRDTSSNTIPGCETGTAYSYMTGERCPAVSSGNTIVTDRVIQIGMRGEDARLVQQFLKNEGYYTGRVDGIYGAISARSVRYFQEDNGLTINGKVDSATLAKINAVIASNGGTVLPPVDPCPLVIVNGVATHQCDNVPDSPSSGSLAISPSSVSVKVGESVRIKATYTSPCPTSGGAMCRPTVTEVFPTWSISNSAVATLRQTTPRCSTSTCPSPTVDVVGVASGNTILSAEYTDSSGRKYERVATIVVTGTSSSSPLSITTNVLANATVGQSYYANIYATGEETRGYSWSHGGNLPSSLSFTQGQCVTSPCHIPAVISGTPTTPGTYTFSVGVVSNDSVSSGTSANKQFTLVVNPADVYIERPYVTLISPNGGETYSPGSQVSINWNNTNWRSSRVNIFLYQSNTTPGNDGYSNPIEIVSGLVNSNSGSGQYNWTIPSNTPTGSNYFIRVNLDVQDPQTGYDSVVDSVRPFTIASATPSVGTLTIDPSSVAVNVGSTMRVKAMYSNCPSGANCLVGPQEVNPTWTLGSTTIARLNQATPRCSASPCPSATTDIQGLVAGNTTLTATYYDSLSHGNITATIKVYVNALALPDISTIEGNVDAISCDIIGGWAYNRNDSSNEIAINIYDETSGYRSLLSRVNTTGLRSDVNTAYSITGNHGFTINTPSSVKDGRSHKISVMALNSNLLETQLTNSPKTITCSVASRVSPNLSASALGGLASTNTDTSTPAQVSPSSYHFTGYLEQGSRGTEVSELQKVLNNAGYNVGAVDGVFGPKVKEALTKFQAANGLKADGIFGYEMRTFLNR